MGALSVGDRRTARPRSDRLRRLLGGVLVALGLTVPSAAAAPATVTAAATAVFAVRTPHASDTPRRYDRVMVRRYGSPRAHNVLVLVPGTLAGASDFALIAPYLAAHVPNLQVWAEMRREGALEDNSELLAVRSGRAKVQQAFDYYLGWLTNPAIKHHYQPLKNSDHGYVAGWGLAVAMDDLHAVITAARRGGRRAVVLGGHSLGGAEAAIYPAWDFAGRAGYRDLKAIVEIDGGVLGRSATISTTAQAQAQLDAITKKGPFLDLLGAGLPWVTGPFAEVGALGAWLEPRSPSIAQAFPALPASFRPPVPVTNRGLFGYAFDASTSPAGLALIHIHSGHLATSGALRDWVDAGPTPIENLARAFAIEPLGPVDWYYPSRLSVDVNAAEGMSMTPAGRRLGLRITHTHQIDVPLYALQTSLGGRGDAVRRGARALQGRSRIPSLTTVDVSKGYAHLDPLLASPGGNVFLRTVAPWLTRVLAPGPRG